MTRFGSAGAKPTPVGLGVDPSRLAWERSGEGVGSIEIAIPSAADSGTPANAAPTALDTPAATGGSAPAGAREQWARGDWVLMRVAGDPSGRILVFDRNEWECFIDGARNGEFDNAAAQ